MIKLIQHNGGAVYLAPDAIARITEAGASSQWHGIRSIVTTFDKQTIEVQDRADDIAKAIAAEQIGGAA
jgi:hypothetical protein